MSDATNEDRTRDLTLTKRVLHQLSYGCKFFVCVGILVFSWRRLDHPCRSGCAARCS